jgi:uncharacterized protein with GYD domain
LTIVFGRFPDSITHGRVDFRWHGFSKRIIGRGRPIRGATAREEKDMPKYLLQANYIGDGIKGLLKEGGTARRAAAEQAIQSIGGKVEAFYYAFGDTDVYVIVDMPDNVSAAASALIVSASGLVRIKTTVLITPDEMDRAGKVTPSYRPPGR